MKRHPSLHPLSRDHHHALVQARKLILAAAANDPGSLAQAAELFAGFWESDLQAHFVQEEQILLPLLARHTSPDGSEIKETLRQHTEIARLVTELKDKLARRETLEATLLEALGEALRQHIRFEESDLFPALESLATEDELWRMNEQLEAARSQAGTGGCALSPRPQETEARR
ncbi:MAG TPA: hemerythrin domain-containing protein [Blastocatellia bacterium]